MKEGEDKVRHPQNQCVYSKMNFDKCKYCMEKSTGKDSGKICLRIASPYYHHSCPFIE